MNIWSLIGIGMATTVLWLGLKSSSDDMRMFWDAPSLFIVLGGTIASISISFQLDRLFILAKMMFVRVVLGKKLDYRPIIQVLMKIADSYSKGEDIEGTINTLKDPFMKESLTLLNDNIFDKDKLLTLLDERVQNMYYLDAEEAEKVRSVAKYPPAFGMMGTTIGMIVLLGNLGGADAIRKMGPAMGVCLITTLYGVILSNMAIMPLGENLVDSAKEVYVKNKMIVEAIRLMTERANPIMVAEKLNSFLPPARRVDWKQTLGKA